MRWQQLALLARPVKEKTHDGGWENEGVGCVFLGPQIHVVPTTADTPCRSQAWAVDARHVGCYTGGKVGPWSCSGRWSLGWWESVEKWPFEQKKISRLLCQRLLRGLNFGWLLGWLVGCLVGWLVGWLVVCFFFLNQILGCDVLGKLRISAILQPRVGQCWGHRFGNRGECNIPIIYSWAMRFFLLTRKGDQVGSPMNDRGDCLLSRNASKIMACLL